MLEKVKKSGVSFAILSPKNLKEPLSGSGRLLFKTNTKNPTA
jgi:hypothetical protein